MGVVEASVGAEGVEQTGMDLSDGGVPSAPPRPSPSPSPPRPDPRADRSARDEPAEGIDPGNTLHHSPLSPPASRHTRTHAPAHAHTLPRRTTATPPTHEHIHARTRTHERMVTYSTQGPGQCTRNSLQMRLTVY